MKLWRAVSLFSECVVLSLLFSSINRKIACQVSFEVLSLPFKMQHLNGLPEAEFLQLAKRFYNSAVRAIISRTFIVFKFLSSFVTYNYSRTQVVFTLVLKVAIYFAQ